MSIVPLPKASQETFDSRFEPIGIAGMGFFGVVFYALTKPDFRVERTRANKVIDDANREGHQKIRAVKICRPGCPSGTRDSSKQLVSEIEAMRRIWINMKDPVRHCFAELYEFHISDLPWYSIEPITSGITMQTLLEATKLAMQPVPEELAFHMMDQVARAFQYLHRECKLVRADVNRNNIMLRFPGKEILQMPDIVLIDWSFWKEASEEVISKDKDDVYDSFSPVLYEGGWPCGQSHDRSCCTANNVNHSPEWLSLYSVMHSKRGSFETLLEEFQAIIRDFRRKIIADGHRAEKISSLMSIAGTPFTGTDLRAVLA